MTDSWYIWYEMYENGKLIPNTRGRYYYPYRHKSSAERRAEQMWGTDVYDPRSDTLHQWKWVVSQTNPWEDTYVFKTKADAEHALFVAKQMIERYGDVTRADILDYVSGNLSEYNFLDQNYGWVGDGIKNARIYKSGSIHILEFPRAVQIRF